MFDRPTRDRPVREHDSGATRCLPQIWTHCLMPDGDVRNATGSKSEIAVLSAFGCDLDLLAEFFINHGVVRELN